MAKYLPFSLIIPTHNRLESLMAVLDSLNQVNYPLELIEVIICSDVFLQPFKTNQYSFKIKFCYTDIPGPSSSRNLGFDKAKNQLVIFLDDDCLVDRQFFHYYKLAWQKYPEARLIGGSIVLPDTQARLLAEKFARHFWCFSTLTAQKEAKLDVGDLLFSANFAYKKLAKKPTKPIFHPDLGTTKKFLTRPVYIGGEDTELAWRLILAQEKVIYFPKIKVIHQITSQRFSWSYVLKRYFFTGVEMALVDQILKQDFSSYAGYFELFKHAARTGKIRQFLPDLFHYVRLLSYLVTKTCLSFRKSKNY